MRREDIMVPEQVKRQYPNAVAHVKDGELFFTAEIVIGGMDDNGLYLTVQDGPAEGEKVYFE